MFDAVVILFPPEEQAKDQGEESVESSGFLRPSNPTPSRVVKSDRPWFTHIFDNKVNWTEMVNKTKENGIDNKTE